MVEPMLLHNDAYEYRLAKVELNIEQVPLICQLNKRKQSDIDAENIKILADNKILKHQVRLAAWT